MTVLSDLWAGERPRRGHGEDDLLHVSMQYLDVALPLDAIAHHSPGEGKRSKGAQIALSRSGYKKGWPDIEIVWRGQPHPIFIELKTARGQLSEAQRAMHQRLTYIGCDVLLCRSLEAMECALRELGLPLRASASGWPPRRVYELTRGLVP